MFKKIAWSSITLVVLLLSFYLQETLYYSPEYIPHLIDAGIKVPVLAYHSVSKGGSDGGFTVSTDHFQEQMKYLHDQGYQAINLDEFRAIMQGREKNDGKKVLITFDDGYENTYTEAYPVLKHYGFTATLFVITDWMDGKEYINWTQAKALFHEGWDIMPHTKNHKSLPLLTKDEQYNEIMSSKNCIERHLKYKVRFFAYPYGFRDKSSVDILKKSGFDYAFTFENGVADSVQDPLLLKRLIVQSTFTLPAFEEEMKLASRVS